jgi:hypothetical protein
MNIFTLRNVGFSLALLASLSACKGSNAPAAASTAQPTPAAEAASSGPAPEKVAAQAEQEAAPTTIPDTADAIWLAIDKQSAELKTTIGGGDLKDVHHKAFAIRDLVAALPERSPSLSADEQTKLQNEVKFVATLADRLDATGDANDKAGAQANYDQLVKVLSGITRTK